MTTAGTSNVRAASPTTQIHTCELTIVAAELMVAAQSSRVVASDVHVVDISPDLFSGVDCDLYHDHAHGSGVVLAPLHPWPSPHARPTWAPTPGPELEAEHVRAPPGPPPATRARRDDDAAVGHGGAAAATPSETQHLWLCSRLGDLEQAEALIEKGASVAGVDDAGRSLAHVLVLGTRASTARVCDVTLKRVLQLGVNVDAQDGQGCTALMYASHRNLPSTATLLVQCGASTTLCDALGMNAHFFAVIAGSTAAVKALCEASSACPVATADLHDHRDVHGRTAFHWCAVVGDPASFSTIIENHAADVVAVDHRGENVLHFLARRSDATCSVLTQKLVGAAPPDCVIKLAALESVDGLTPEQVAHHHSNSWFLDVFAPALLSARRKHTSTPHHRDSTFVMPQLSCTRGHVSKGEPISKHRAPSSCAQQPQQKVAAQTSRAPATNTGDTVNPTNAVRQTQRCPHTAAAERSEYHRMYNKVHRQKRKRLSGAVDLNVQALEERNRVLCETLRAIKAEVTLLRDAHDAGLPTERCDAPPHPLSL